MLLISRTRVLTISLACLAMAASSIALANDEQTQSSQPNQNQQQAQSSQPSGPQLNAQIGQPQRSSVHQSTRNPQRSGLRYDTPGAPRSSSAPRNQESRGHRGASLGVNIVSSEDGQGVTVMRIHPNTPAQQMGLRPRDRITTLNGEPVRSVDQFISDIRGMNPGDRVELGIVRDSNERTIRGELEGYTDSIAETQSPNGNRENRPFQSAVAPDRSNRVQSSSPDQFSRDAQRSANLQTIYEEGGEPAGPRSGDLEARLTRVEQQIDRITQDIDEIRNQIGTAPLTPERDTNRTDFRARPQTPPNQPQPNAQMIKKNDRWSNDNRFDSGDLSAARQRAAQEAARRRAQQLGTELQQQERERAAKSQQNNKSSDKPPSDQSQK
jgi:hypothetical protein